MGKEKNGERLSVRQGYKYGKGVWEEERYECGR